MAERPRPRFIIRSAGVVRRGYRVSLVGANGQTMMTSEKYATRGNARRAADDARAAAAEAEVVVEDA